MNLRERRSKNARGGKGSGEGIGGFERMDIINYANAESKDRRSSWLRGMKYDAKLIRFFQKLFYGGVVGQAKRFTEMRISPPVLDLNCVLPCRFRNILTPLEAVKE